MIKEAYHYFDQLFYGKQTLRKKGFKRLNKMNTKDMTVGRPGKLLLTFAIPLMLGNVFQQLYTFVDTAIVGQVLGVNALAALGATEWMTFIMFGSIAGVTQGFSVTMAQHFGAAEYGMLRKSIVNAMYLAIVGAVIFTVLGQLIIYPILGLLKTPDGIIELSESYLRILYMGVPISMSYNLLAAILRALGNSKTPLQAMIAASLCNIALDFLFVFEFGWGIRGAAFATVLAQSLAMVFCIIKLKGIKILSVQSNEYIFDKDICYAELKLGVPIGLQNIITAIGGLIIQAVINGFGILFIAGYTAANKLYGLLEIAAASYSYAMSSYAGQNMGAGQVDRVRKGLRTANIIGIITAYGMSAIMLFYGKMILSCFIAADAATVQATIKIGYQFLKILAVFFPLLYILYVTRACIQGMGNTLLPMISSIAQLIMRMGCALILTRFIGETGVFWGEIAAWTGADIILLFSYYYYVKNIEVTGLSAIQTE